jgi:pimeloyl-ACP methyl ester carboxylesterase
VSPPAWSQRIAGCSSWRSERFPEECPLRTPEIDKIALTFTNHDAGRQAARAVVARLKAAVLAGTIRNDVQIPRQTIERQDRARTVLWSRDNSNFTALATIRVPALATAGRSDTIDTPTNSLLKRQSDPFSWRDFFEGGHAFLFESLQQFADSLKVFLRGSALVAWVSIASVPSNS